ncbi:MAG: recombinase family protein [Bryobacteraceae bacterium]|nr:recombinase family protein [Bryobacteraceae bacterium]
MIPKITTDHLSRRAIVYIRQSSPGQVIHNQESQRRQYGLADHARSLGFHSVEVIDEDLGRSGSGQVERPGFQHLVAEVCTGQVGAVLSIEASRLARNGRDWHHLIELCGLVRALVIDPDGIYDPCLLNDRLLLGLKGTMSEFELNLLRQRSLEAIRQKAKRGELQFRLPVGFRWTRHGKVEVDPDRRIQNAIRLAFTKAGELGSARQVLLWFRGEKVELPALVLDSSGADIEWKLPVYNTIWHMLRNPMYAGAYAFGKTEARTRVVGGRARKSEGHPKPFNEWTVLIRDHHPGYITWEQFESNQSMLARNAHMKSRMEPKAGRGGRSLLAGLLRCRRCGRMLHVTYSGTHGEVPRYHCRGAHINHGADWCISFGGLKPDRAVAAEILKAVEGNAIEAALEVAARIAEQQRERQHSLSLELEQARYEARLAARRYESVDPDNRLVAAELEARWNSALSKAGEVEQRLRENEGPARSIQIPDRHLLYSLAQNLPAVWNSPATDMRLKQRIVRILVEEIVADVDETTGEIVLLIHWSGGRHSELRMKKNLTGRHSRCTDLETIDVLKRMAERFPDDQIAATLNRLGLHTGPGNTWTEGRVRAVRSYHQLPPYSAATTTRETLTLEQASERLGISHKVVRRLIEAQKISATQVVPWAPWEISAESIDSPDIVSEISKLRKKSRRTRVTADESLMMFAQMEAKQE